jgi:TldD protein
MKQEIIQADSFFNRNFGIGSSDLEKVLATALGKRADYADLYFEYRRNEGISLEESLVKNCSQSTANGVGVRVLAETKTGYAHTDDITIENLELAARTAQYIAQSRQSELPVAIGQAKSEAHDLYPVKVSVTDVPLDKKVALLYEIDRYARELDASKNVFVSRQREQLYWSPLHDWLSAIFSRHPLKRHLHRGGKRQRCHSSGGGSGIGLVDTGTIERYARAGGAKRSNLSAQDAPGTMDVVLGLAIGFRANWHGLS